jgi:hypothetical protein
MFSHPQFILSFPRPLDIMSFFLSTVLLISLSTQSPNLYSTSSPSSFCFLIFLPHLILTFAAVDEPVPPLNTVHVTNLKIDLLE